MVVPVPPDNRIYDIRRQLHLSHHQMNGSEAQTANGQQHYDVFRNKSDTSRIALRSLKG